jgi:hypothetical protein
VSMRNPTRTDGRQRSSCVRTMGKPAARVEIANDAP